MCGPPCFASVSTARKLISKPRMHNSEPHRLEAERLDSAPVSHKTHEVTAHVRILLDRRRKRTHLIRREAHTPYISRQIFWRTSTTPRSLLATLGLVTTPDSQPPATDVVRIRLHLMRPELPKHPTNATSTSETEGARSCSVGSRYPHACLSGGGTLRASQTRKTPGSSPTRCSTQSPTNHV